MLLNKSMLSSLGSSVDVSLQPYETLRCATFSVITSLLLSADCVLQQRCQFVSCEILYDCLISFRLYIFVVLSQGLFALWRNSMNLYFWGN